MKCGEVQLDSYQARASFLIGVDSSVRRWLSQPRNSVKLLSELSESSKSGSEWSMLVLGRQCRISTAARSPLFVLGILVPNLALSLALGLGSCNKREVELIAVRKKDRDAGKAAERLR